MTQSGQPGAPPPPGQPPGAPPGAPPPPPDWQSTPQQPAPPPAGGTPSWTANLTSQAPVPGPAGYYYADVPNRIIAYIIDAIILFVLFIIVGIILSAIFGPTTRTVLDPTQPFGFRIETNFVSTLVSAIANLAVTGAYFVYTWMNMRGTPGMKVLGMQVGNETDGRTITMNQAITRFLLLGAPFGLAQALTGISSLSVIIGLIAFIYFIALLVTTAQSPTKQGLHDRYAHTVVVKAARAVG
jgi:uncharacterized RDD family membrane protein YckC